MRRMPLLLLMMLHAAVGTNASRGQEQEQPPRVSLLKTGLLGMGTEPGFAAKGPMLNYPAVQRELKMTEAQIARLKQQAIPEANRISQRLAQETRRLLRESKAQGDQEGLDEVERAQWTLMRTLTREDERPLLAVLDSRQVARLEQLQLQAEGPWAFLRPQVQDRLRMSPEQVEAVTAVVEEGKKTVAESASLPAGEEAVSRRMAPEKRAELLKSKEFTKKVDGVRKHIATARRDVMRGIAEVLNRKQQSTFDKMLGEPFGFQGSSEKPAPGTGDAPRSERSAPDLGKSPGNR